jgi:hypothetical protein
MRKMICWITAAFLFPLLPDNAGALDNSITLDSLAPTSQEVSFTVPPSGSIPVRIMRSGVPASGGKADLTLSEFIGEQGLSANVKLAVDKTTLPPATSLEGVPFPGTFLPIHLQVPPLPTAGKYSGTLSMVIPGKGLVGFWRFRLISAQEIRPATLVLDQGAATLNAVNIKCFGKSMNPSVTVHVRDKTGNWMLEGVTVRLDPGMTTPPGHGFDMKRNLTVRFNNQEVKDIGVSPPMGERSVPSREQAAMELQFRNLDIGAYTIPLRFNAANSGPDDQQRLTVTIQVRHWWPWAVFTLIIAAMVSFAGTQVVTAMRRRAAFLERLREMRPAWLAQEIPVLPVIWLRAKLRQVEELSNRFLLTGKIGIDVRLTQAAGMLSTIDRIHQLRERLENHLQEKEIRNRAIWALDRIVSDIDADPSEQEIAQIKTDLDALELWLDPTKTDSCYWAELLPHIRRLMSEVQISHILDGCVESTQLLEDLKNEKLTSSPPDHEKMIAIEKEYQLLRILWDRRNTKLLPQLVRMYKEPIETIFRTVDDADWERLKKSADEGKLIVKGPSPNSLDPVEAYMPVTFRLETEEDNDLLQTYLLLKKLNYAWKFEIQVCNLFGKLANKGELEVTSAEPKVTQYAPEAGQIILKEVSIQYASKPKPISLKSQAKDNSKEPGGLWTVNVVKSSDFRIWRIAESADYIALFVAVIAGIATGLLLYMQNPIFGSLKDYLQLFMWGAGIDQGKNFIQALGSWGDTRP